ncbi:MAG: hypothetical protein ACUVT7_09380 [Thermoplasmata archaeon]
MIVPFSSWASWLGDREVLSIAVYTGSWDISGHFQCYVGNFLVNGDLIDIANGKRCGNSNSELPPGF